MCWTYNATQNLDHLGQPVPGTFPGFATISEWTRAASEQSWARVANITFTGWDNVCFQSGQGDDQDRSVNPATIMFAFDSRGDSADIRGKDTQFGTMIRISTATTDQADYRTTAIQEMGHALGFAHEQERPDNYDEFGNPKTCLTGGDRGPLDGGFVRNTVGASTRVDKGSTMCYDTEGDLSPDDIMGVQKLYGRKPSGSIVGNYSDCVKSGADAGSLLVSASCQTTSEVTWSFDKLIDGTDLLRSKSNTSLCWSDAWPSFNPSGLVADTCADQSTFAFPLRNMRWRAIGETCVQVSSASAGATLFIGGCSNSANERWNFFEPLGFTGGEQVGQIQLAGTNLCVTAPNTTAALGEVPSLDVCITSGDFSKQTFTLTKGTSNVTYANLCMNVFGGWPDAGATVGFWNGCADPQTQNALFHLSGSLTSSGKCAYFAAARGSQVLSGTCQDAPPPDRRGFPVRDPQEWDIYW